MEVLASQGRTLAIAQLSDVAREHYSVPYQGKTVDAPRLRLRLGDLVYRINNGRTRIEQLKRISEDGLPQDFFDGKQESQSAQNLQHLILLEMSKDPKADVYAELQSAKIQREPLIVTRNGVVVNGNRRLAAIRDLYAKAPSKFPGFEHVDVALLPPGATEQDIEDVETEYQELPETRLSYGWLARRLKMRYQLEKLGLKPDALRAKYHLRAIEDVNRELQQLSLVEEYLEFIGKPKFHYWEAQQSEEIFKRLQQALAKSAPDKIELRRLVGFNLISMGGSLDDRLYKFHPVFGNDLDKISQRFLKENPAMVAPDMPQSLEPNGGATSDDPLDDISPPAPNPLDILVEKLRTPVAPNVNPVSRFVQIYEDIKKEESVGDLRRLPFTKAQEANRILAEIDISIMDPATKNGFIKQLDAILNLANGLREQMSNGE